MNGFGESTLFVYKAQCKGKPLFSSAGNDCSSAAVIKGKQLPWKAPVFHGLFIEAEISMEMILFPCLAVLI